MELLQLPQAFTVCKAPDDSQINLTQDYCFVGKTAEEFSLVCPTERVPAATTAREDGWRALKVQGILDFPLVGILSAIASALAERNIPLFALSTYNTDYILIKEEHFAKAADALRAKGYTVIK